MPNTEEPMTAVNPAEVELLTAAQAAAMFPVHTETVRRWTREGRLAAITLPSGRKRYRRSDVESLLSTPLLITTAEQAS